MKPEPFEGRGLKRVLGEMGEDEVRYQRHDFPVDLAAFLHEQLVASADTVRSGAVQETEIVADVVGESRLELGRYYFPGVAPLTVSVRSTTNAVAASPKMKWLSRSRKFACPERISGLQTRMARA